MATMDTTKSVLACWLSKIRFRKFSNILFFLKMDEYGRLGSMLLFSLVCLQLAQQCDSRLVVNIDVTGKYVVKTGIKNYSIPSWNHNAIIICSSPVSVPAIISLLNNEGKVIANNSASGNGISFVKIFVNRPIGKYQCVLNISIWVSNDSWSDFSVWSEVEMKTNWAWPFCSSSIGNSAYVGEKAILNCTYSSNIYCWWENTRTNVIEVFVAENNLRRSCSCTRCRNCNNFECSLLISVVQSISLDISITVNDTNLNTSVMEFLCTSTPPRLLFWKVFGTHGDLLDLDNIDRYLNVNTTVNITQSPGETSLRLSESVSGGNAIHTVMCSTYDTGKRIVDFVHIQTPSKSSSNCEKSFPEPTDMPSTTFDNRITTVGSTTLVMATTEGDSNDVELASTVQGYEMKTDTINDYLLSGFVSLPYLVIILILIGIIFYMNYKNRKKTELSTEVSAHYTPPETVLHDNPVYLSFSETKDCSPDNENEETEITYANL